MLDGMILRDLRFPAGRTTIGRRPNNDIVLENGMVSGDHAVILMGEDGHVYAQDLGSRNGTVVNGEMITRARLRTGDVIKIGGFKLRFFGDNQDEEEHAKVDVDTQVGTESPDADSGPAAGPTLRILTGPQAGRVRPLKNGLTTVGKPHEQVAVISRRPNGYVVAHLEGRLFPVVNGVRMGPAAQLLADGDRIEVGGAVLEFCLPRVS